MLEIKKSRNSHGYDVFDIVTDNGTFEISYENNLDLYWRYIYHNSLDKEDNQKEFKITKENYYLYSLFCELYDAIKEKKPYKTFPSIIDEDLRNKKLNYYGGYELYNDKIITWYSDDFAEFANASNFSIKKEKDYFLVTFTKSKTEYCNGFVFPTYSVRIRNSGSRFSPFNNTFMGMYQKLKEYDSEYHQIHIEEYLYEEKTKKRVLSK